jgi:hypothetical protein
MKPESTFSSLCLLQVKVTFQIKQPNKKGFVEVHADIPFVSLIGKQSLLDEFHKALERCRTTQEILALFPVDCQVFCCKYGIGGQLVSVSTDPDLKGLAFSLQSAKMIQDPETDQFSPAKILYVLLEPVGIRTRILQNSFKY